MLSNQEQNFESNHPHEAAEALQQVIDLLSDGCEPIVQPLESEPIPWRSAEAFEVYQRLSALEEYCDRKFEAQKNHFEQKLLQMRVDHELLESRAFKLERQLEDFEQTFEPAPSPAVQWVRAIAFALIGAALTLGAITASDYVNLSLPAQPVPTVGSK